MRLRLLVFFIIFIENYLTGKCLKMVELKVPNIIDPREEKVKLYCNYELDAGEKLYSIKWYKDTNEFYRFMPDANPSGVDFHVDDIQVDIIDSNDKVITLIQNLDILNYETSGLAGSYACEVSTDAPTFHMKFDVANMSIAVLPQRDPALEGLRSHYDDGDILEAQCTSSPSFPSAKLAFYINDIEVKKSLTRELPGVGLAGGNLSMTRLGLSLPLVQRYFKPSGNLRLTCKSILPGISGSKSRETSTIISLGTNNERLAQEAKVSISSPSSSSSSSNKYYFNNHLLSVILINIIIIKI
ncbi:hypothetical protein HCN44_009727 [Aphidius gifuensis]|uniref:Ig-like domain-containing protein n=1 Tax=Aphidius gifuensis TaxID=684658 RepID=A0A835CWG9_APHGI|nr:uncharacterized protein LOC122860503 [Aphidius gifuensis]KAF7998329.1 hypothetical protein HCN44_009727 [Aphidius gifuensis]